MYPPLGDGALYPLKGTAERVGVVTTGLSVTDCASIDLTATPADGESMLVGATLWFASSWAAVPTRPAADFIAASFAFSGRTIEELSPGATPLLWQRVPDGFDAIVSAVATAGGASSIQMLAGVHDQGQAQYHGVRGCTTDKDAFKALTSAYFDAVETEAALKFGQATRPGWFVFQPGGQYVVDALNMSIGNALVELGQQRDNVFVVGPDGHYPDYLGHPDANAQRWMGMQVRKVMRRVLIGRKGWEPLDACRFEQRDARTIWIHHIVPVPPLKWAKAYIVSKGTTVAGRGFRVEDAAGFLTLAATPKILGQTVVELKVNRDLVGDPDAIFVWSGSQVDNKGVSNLADSDAEVFPEQYRYLPGSGMQAAANIAALADQPYPAANYCVGYRRPISWTR